jgi:hypothetical protein
LKRELKCGHCATNAHERLPAPLRKYCDETKPKANQMSNRQLLHRVQVAADLARDYLADRLTIKYCPRGIQGDDAASEGHLYEITTVHQEWHWYACLDDRRDLREQIAGWARTVASWYIGLADDVEEIASTKRDEVAIYDVVAADGEVMDRSFDCGRAKGVCEEMTKRGLVCRVMERTVKLPAGVEVQP